MTRLHLEEINAKFNASFTRHFTGMMLECCVVCFNTQNHKTNVVLKKDSHTSNLIEKDCVISWQLKIDPILYNTHRDANQTTEYGAMCLSLLLADSILTEKGIWLSSQQGEGVDFWLLNTVTLQPIIRLEISGIRKQTATNLIGTRAKRKMKQTNQSDSSDADAYISIIEFSETSALFIQK